jgi:molybdate-binding protein
VAEVRHVAREEPIVLVTLARWEAGLVVRGGGDAVRRAADLARPGLRIAGREPGAGARRLLERVVRAEGLPTAIARRPHLELPGHLEVAHAVALGAADAGVATRDVALALGLDFVALAEERFDLAFPRSSLSDPRVQRLLDAIVSGEVRRELAALGYDVRGTGERVAEVRAA